MMYAIRWKSKAFQKATGWYCNSACEVETFGLYDEARYKAIALSETSGDIIYIPMRYSKEEDWYE